MSSTTSTPLLSASPSQPLPASIPPLTTTVLPSASYPDALHLIADSIAQQRQLASRALLLSAPLFTAWLLTLALTLALTYRVPSDIGTFACTAGGLTMALLLATRPVTAPYLAAAEALSLSFLAADDLVLATRFGPELIGVCVVRCERRRGAKKGGAALVRAWTVKLRYRRKGVGTALLEEAVDKARERLGGEVEVGFASDHANSKEVLPRWANGGFRKRQEMAVRRLNDVVAGRTR